VTRVFDNPQKSLHLLEQFHPFSAVSQVADFVFETLSIAQSVTDARASAVSLLPAFKSVHLSGRLTESPFPSIPAPLPVLRHLRQGDLRGALFLRRWKFPLAQLEMHSAAITLN
jgi:hypothetical protein